MNGATPRGLNETVMDVLLVVGYARLYMVGYLLLSWAGRESREGFNMNSPGC